METLSAPHSVTARLPCAESPGSVLQISFQAFAQILAAEREKPGRKIILWVSPGWPPLADLENERDAKPEASTVTRRSVRKCR